MRNFPERWPHFISAVGILHGLISAGEGLIFIFWFKAIPPEFLPGIITSIPFIIGLIYGGYWLANSELTPDRYESVAHWWIGGMSVTVVLILIVASSVQSLPPLMLIGTVRWSAAIGGGVGLTIGVLYVRAIQRAVESEQARRRQQEIQEERDHLEEFASIVAHDLRNPLNVAEGRLDLLREECDSPHLEPISEAHTRMDEIIEETLTLARMGQAVGDTTLVDLSDVATQCWNTVESADATLQTDGSATIRADKDRLQHLYENLFRNALEHGGEDVTIRVGRCEDATGFYIEDNGPGIPESERERIFESGYSGSSEGTGLGLSIVKRIAEAHNWQISVTESDEGGARFEITGVEYGDG
ncbi:sensor histidine kinase [Salinibaculum rarum]|uniref:sensor histidine kinase n=1 Tax=Salinibaculum rarum TaxID=3058903 RepID=UPI00265F1939|nr:HAMP domain-containing sensor histidine kinase [Salinibaculum sp. KK48]